MRAGRLRQDRAARSPRRGPLRRGPLRLDARARADGAARRSVPPSRGRSGRCCTQPRCRDAGPVRAPPRRPADAVEGRRGGSAAARLNGAHRLGRREPLRADRHDAGPARAHRRGGDGAGGFGHRAPGLRGGRRERGERGPRCAGGYPCRVPVRAERGPLARSRRGALFGRRGHRRRGRRPRAGARRLVRIPQTRESWRSSPHSRAAPAYSSRSIARPARARAGRRRASRRSRAARRSRSCRRATAPPA